MKRIMIAELSSYLNQEVVVSGWIHRLRKLGKIAFIILRDKSGQVQCVIDTKTIDIKDLKLEAVIKIKGKVKLAQGKSESLEIQVISIDMLSPANEDLPIEINKENMDISLDVMLNNRALSLRNPKLGAVLKVKAVLAQAFSEFLIKNDFTQIFTPKIVAQGTEGGSNLFELNYFETKAYLAQSPQFYKQMMVGAGFERVFEIGHVYRAESHDTKRHLNEYVSLDVEFGFIQDEYEIMELENRLLDFMMKEVESKCSRELELLGAQLPKVPYQIPKMKLSEAISILNEKYNLNDLQTDLSPKGEKLLSEYIKREFNSDFVFITHYPQSKRPMYTMPYGEGETRSFDLLFRGLEITTGGQRIHNYTQLLENIAKRGLPKEQFKDYLYIFKYGMPPHGGFAIGLERITSMLLGFDNVRYASAFPRDKMRLTP